MKQNKKTQTINAALFTKEERARRAAIEAAAPVSVKVTTTPQAYVSIKDAKRAEAEARAKNGEALRVFTEAEAAAVKERTKEVSKRYAEARRSLGVTKSRYITVNGDMVTIEAEADAEEMARVKFTEKDMDKLRQRSKEVEKARRQYAALADSSDVLMRAFYEIVEAETRDALDYIDGIKRAPFRDIYAAADSLDTEALVAFLRDSFEDVKNNDTSAVATFEAYAARLAFSKTKGKFQRHADNAKIRERRANTLKWKRYAANGGAFEACDASTVQITKYINGAIHSIIYGKFEAKHNADGSAARDADGNIIYEKVRDGLNSYFPTIKDAVNEVLRYMVKDSLRLLFADCIEAARRAENNDTLPLAGDTELVNEAAAALVQFANETSVSDFDAVTEKKREYFDGYYNRVMGRTSTRTEEISGRTFAARAMDELIAQYKLVQNVADTRDIEGTLSGTIGRGVKQLNDEERACFDKAARAIQQSANFEAWEGKYTALIVLKMKMQGFGYDVIARFMHITKQAVRDNLEKIGAACARSEELAHRVSLERDARRHYVPIALSVHGEKIPKNHEERRAIIKAKDEAKATSAEAKATKAAKRAEAAATRYAEATKAREAAEAEANKKRRDAAAAVALYKAERAEREAKKAFFEAKAKAAEAEAEAKRAKDAAEAEARRLAENVEREARRLALLETCANVEAERVTIERDIKGKPLVKMTTARTVSAFEAAALVRDDNAVIIKAAEK